MAQHSDPARAQRAQHSDPAKAQPGEQTQQSVTVGQLLAEPLLRGCVAGSRAGLDRSVTWCLPWSEVCADTADLTGVAVHLPASELVPPEKARRVVEQLSRRGVPALFAWQRREDFCDLGPAARAADSSGLALLAVPNDVDYHRLGRLVATKVLAQSAHVLEYSVRVHRTLGEVFESGSGLSALANAMAVLAQTPVLVLDPTGAILAQGTAGQLPDGLSLDEVAGAIASGGDGHPHGGSEVVLEVADRSVHTTVVPVTVAGERYGLVAVVETAVLPADSHDLAQHRVVAEQGATLTGSEMLRQRSVLEAEERARDDFVDALVHARFTDPHELTARSRHHRFDPQARFAVYVVTGARLSTDRRQDTQRVLGAVRSAGLGAGSAAGSSAGSTAGSTLLTLAAPIGSMVVVVRQAVPPSAHPDPVEERDAVRRFADQLRRSVGDLAGEGTRVAYGRAGQGASGVADSYREARMARELARHVDGREVCGYEDLRLYAALRDLATSTQGRSFAREILEPLRKADGQTSSLEEVVLAYVAESGNLNAAARRLSLHRNTMLYKLDRASRALRMDVRRSETQFMVWLAHHVDTLAEVSQALDTELSPPV